MNRIDDAIRLLEAVLPKADETRDQMLIESLATVLGLLHEMHCATRFDLNLALFHAETTGDVEPLTLIAQHHFGVTPVVGENPRATVARCQARVDELIPR